MSTETITEPSPQTTTEVVTLEEAVVEKLRQLPPDKQQEVRDFVEFLHLRVGPKQPKKSVKGIGKHLVDKAITAEEIQQARREMWGEYMGEEDAA